MDSRQHTTQHPARRRGWAPKIKPLVGAVALTLSLGAATQTANASLSDAMDGFYDSYAVNDPGYYQGQSAGFVNFGQVAGRTGTQYYQPISIQAPSAQFGCSGIDAFLGGFSFINMDQIVQMARQVGSHAVSTAFYLALDSLSPELGALMKQMQDWANKVNQFNMDSCQTAVDINRGALGAMGMQDSVCKRFKNGKTLASDNFASRFECGSEKDWDWSLLNPLSDDGQAQSDGDKIKKALQGNIVWQAAKNAGIEDEDILELIMSLTGTVIWPESARGASVSALQDKFVKNTLSWSELIEAGGDNATGKVHMLKCSSHDDGCLTVSETVVDAQFANPIRDKVEAGIEEIENAIAAPPSAAHTGFSDNAKLVLGMSRLPIFQMLQAEADAGMHGLVKMEYTDVLVAEIMYRWLEKFMSPMEGALLSSANMPGGETGQAQAQRLADRVRTVINRAQREFATEMERSGGMRAFIDMHRNLKSLMAQRITPSMSERINFAKALTR